MIASDTPSRSSAADVRLLYAARGLRGFGDGFAVIILPAYLSAIGYSPLQIGIVAPLRADPTHNRARARPKARPKHNPLAPSAYLSQQRPRQECRVALLSAHNTHHTHTLRGAHTAC
jgi:hypothetical protein